MTRDRIRMLVPIMLACILLGIMASRGRLESIRPVDIVSLIAVGFALGVTFRTLIPPK